MISLIVFLKVTLHFVRKDMNNHKKNCQRSTGKNERTWVRIDRIRIKNVRSSNICKRNNTEKSTGKSKNITSQISYQFSSSQMSNAKLLMSFTQSKC